MIQEFEGLRLTPYEDPYVPGLMTVGWGHTGPVAHKGKTINTTDAALLLNSDLAKAAEAVERLVPGLPQHTFCALCSFVFNLGAGSLEESTLRKRLLAGEDPYVVLPEELPKWVKANGKVVAGLVRRRQTEVLHAQKDGPRAPQPGARPPAVAAVEGVKAVKLSPFFQHYQAEPHQAKAVQELEAALLAKAPELLKSDAAWVKAYRNKPTSLVQLPVPYQYQLDSSTRHGARMCFSSTNAMVVEYLRPGTLRGQQEDDAYLAKVLQFGDTTSAEAQVSALKTFGIRAAFRQDGTSKRARDLLASGVPVPMGVLHHGNYNNPQGGGHWVLAVGFDQTRAEWIIHDPNGKMDLINGGYASNAPTAGRFVRYACKQFDRRWMVGGEGDGWFLEVHK